jgi:hypothetical protein
MRYDARVGRVYWIAAVVLWIVCWRRGMRWPQIVRVVGVTVGLGLIVGLGFRMIARGQSLLGAAVVVVALTSSAWWPRRKGDARKR